MGHFTPFDLSHIVCLTAACSNIQPGKLLGQGFYTYGKCFDNVGVCTVKTLLINSTTYLLEFVFAESNFMTKPCSQFPGSTYFSCYTL